MTPVVIKKRVITDICVYICVYFFVYICVYFFVYMCVYIFVFICVYICFTVTSGIPKFQSKLKGIVCVARDWEGYLAVRECDWKKTLGKVEGLHLNKEFPFCFRILCNTNGKLSKSLSVTKRTLKPVHKEWDLMTDLWLVLVLTDLAFYTSRAFILL